MIKLPLPKLLQLSITFLGTSFFDASMTFQLLLSLYFDARLREASYIPGVLDGLFRVRWDGGVES
jgi:hypothetical protein